MTDVEVGVGGETLTLLPERGAFWPRRGTLFVADVHWGKAAAFRAAGVAVPRGTTTGGLARLDAMVSRTGATQIVFLGDLLHAREGRTAETLRMLGEWRARRRGIEMRLVRGNHDRHAGDPPAELGIACADAPVIDLPFVLAHHPGVHPEGYVLAGHAHPAVRMYGAGRMRARLPCFRFGSRGGILPAFGDFTGLADISPAHDDRIFAVVEDRVIEIAVDRSCRVPAPE